MHGYMPSIRPHTYYAAEISGTFPSEDVIILGGSIIEFTMTVSYWGETVEEEGRALVLNYNGTYGLWGMEMDGEKIYLWEGYE